MQNFVDIQINDLQINPWELIGKQWMLINAGNKNLCNPMTASWGGFGVLWARNVTFCVIRPTRFTYELMEKSNYYSLNFFDENYKDVLNFCGKNSGRDINKIQKNNLTPIEHQSGAVYFEQAQLVIICKKLYYQDINPANFFDPTIDVTLYPKKDYHRMYVGEIVSILKK